MKILHFLFSLVCFVITASVSAESYACEQTTYNYSNCYCQNNLQLGADWLYWKAEQSQMEIASNVAGTDSGSTVNSTLLKPDFTYSNGYRVYADYLPNKCWTIGAAFVHLPSEPSVFASNDPASIATNFIAFNDSLFPIFTTFSQSGIFLSSFDIQWDLDLYYLDAYIRRKVFIYSCINFEPYIGARGFWMHQKMQMSGSAPAAQASLTALFTEKFCGAGLLGGLNAYWQMWCGFSLVAQFGGSLIYSSVRNDFDVQADQAGTPLRILNKNRFHKSHPCVDSFVGLQYRHAFCLCSTEAHIGWENHLFFHTNQFTLTSDGSLSLQGLTLGGSISF